MVKKGRGKSKRNDKKWSMGTQTVHSGEERVKYADALTVPIVQTSTYVFHSTEEIKRYTTHRVRDKEAIRYEYARYGNPTQEAVEKKLSILEEAEACLLFATGMSAVTTTLLCLLDKGDHIILTDDVYGQTLKFCTRHLPRYGIGFTVTKMGDYKGMRKAIRKSTRIIFSESPTNPYLNIIDMDEMRDIRKIYNGLMVIDSTFATPYNQKPLKFGMDLVIHSATKYLAGHNDILAGAVLGSKELLEKITDFQYTTGATMDPHCCYLLLRGIKTAAIRVDYQNKSAQKIAEFLEGHPKIRKVFYPGLKSHPQHEIAKAQMEGYGGVVSFWTKGDLKKCNKFLDSLKAIYIAPSLGGVESLMSHPATVTYYRNTRKERYALGITDQLCRLALGIEDPDDIIADLDQALWNMDK